MVHHGEYRQWPFLNEEEFDLACAFFDQRYVRAHLGPTRQIFKIRHRRIATTGSSYVEILRLLQLPKEPDELSALLEGLGGDWVESAGSEMQMDSKDEDADQEVLRPDSNELPSYTPYAQQPYVTYEVHLHPTYRLPTLWFTLHDLPAGEPAFDLDAVYRHLVPPQYKDNLRALGVTGGISAAPHPITDVPAFFIHPCQTKEAMEQFDCVIDKYLMMWIGLVGGCVGLWVPPEMAAVP
ncbi:uncharacterized protein PAC_00558 [Phialocephala subalpina]|uniref:Ubiquitin-like-conjugating enzyme ATG10 n=1 Tax=Phialocephala subalpina TaxID=576137 RepID=A0A1L7WD20_9HELO|nr:uncharacterized protein PAC_00558 [Phialocephala subalpina]